MELNKILEEHDFTKLINYSGSLGKGISKAEFKAICQEAIGKDKPDNTVSFIVKDTDNNVFSVYYNSTDSEFYFEKLTRKKV